MASPGEKEQKRDGEGPYTTCFFFLLFLLLRNNSDKKTARKNMEF